MKKVLAYPMFPVRGLMNGRRALHFVMQGLVVQALVQVLNILTGLLTARLLGPEGRGELIVLTVWPYVLGTLATSGLPSAITYHLARRREGAQPAFVAAILLALAMAVAAIALAHAVIPALMPAWSAELVTTATTLAWFVLLNAVMIVCRQFLLAQGSMAAYHGLYVGPPLAYLVALVAVHTTVGLTPVGAAVCLLASGLPSCLVAFGLILKEIATRRGVSATETLSWSRSLSGYAVRAYSGEVVFLLLPFVERLALANVVDASDLGIYNVAGSLSGLLFFVALGAGQVLLRALTKASPTRRAEIHDHAVRLGFWFVALLSTGLWIVGGPAITVAFGSDFEPAVPVFHLLLVSSGLICVAQLAGQTALSMGWSKLFSASELLGAVTAILGILLAAPYYGVMGAGIATIVGAAVRLSLILGVLHFCCAIRLSRILPSAGDLRFVRDALG